MTNENNMTLKRKHYAVFSPYQESLCILILHIKSIRFSNYKIEIVIKFEFWQYLEKQFCLKIMS